MALKKPSDFFGIEKVSTLSEQVEQISQDHCSDLEENISLSFSNIDGVFKNIQEQLLTSGKNQIVEVKEDLVELYKVVGDLIENEIPKYKKQVNTSELRVETRISNLKKELCEHFEDQVKDTKEKIEELYKEVITEEVFNARSFVKSLYNSEIQIAVEKYVSTYSNDIVSLREEIFKEIKKKPNGLVAIENKLQDLAYKYKVLSENLNDKNTNDPLLQSPVTFEQLKNHYQLLVGRLQEQLASVGGGGEVRLKYLDDIVGIATNSSAYNGKFLKYNHSLEKFEFVSITDQTGIDLTDLSVSVSSPGISDLSYDNTTGVFTYTPQSLVGYATEGYVDNAVVGYATEGYVDNAVVGFITSGSLVGYATEGYVDNAVVGLASEGYVDNAVVGLASEGYVDNLVAISTFSGNYNDLSNKPLIPSIVGLASEGYVDNAIFGISTEKYWESTAAGIHTLSNVGIGTTNPTSKLTVDGNVRVTGVVTATTFVGNFSGSITNATNLTGGTANASSLNVSGVTTISQGRIQADAVANLRFGNLPAGSGSGRNIAIGDQVLVSLSGGSGRNIGIGELSYYDTTTGQYNIGVGGRAGQKVSTGSYNVILGAYDGNSGNLDIRTSSNNVVIADGEGNIRQYINSSGNVGIKTTVVTEALTVVGVVSATSFYGTLNADQLTGVLPAIDGSALFGVISTGAGVEIREDGTIVGTAATIDIGSNLSVSFGSGIATVSGSGFATYANIAGIATYAAIAGVSTTSGTATYASTAGVSTTSGTSGYATTAGISSAVSGTININTTGIITASSFSGSGASLTNIPAGQLTGTLPAIDGSALLNVNATGSGIVVLDDNVNVGSARTINFGTGLDVSYSTSGIATITASGGSLQSRTTVSGTTASLANNGIGNTNITGFKSYALMKVGLSTAGWLRIYTDSASRVADASRSIGIDPLPGSGVIAEVVTTGISTTQIISPFVMGGNLDDPADTTIYAAITNLSGSTQSITANLTILQLEA